jgi:hypothetical protein
MTYDSTQDTLTHIGKVQARIGECIANLHERLQKHDASKLGASEKPGYDLLTAAMAGLTYGTDEYKAAMAKVMADSRTEAAWAHHTEVNDHHPEHWENGINDMSLLSILEMLCDWKGASERNGPGNLAIRYSIERHKIGPQLARILENTVKELNW